MNGFILFCVSLFFFCWGFANLSIAIMHDLARDLGVSLTQIRWVISLFMLVFALTQIVWGVLSDRFGRRKILWLAFSLSVIGSLSCALSDRFVSFAGGQMVLALAAGCYPGLARSLLADRLHDKALAMAMVWVTVSIAITPVLAAFISVQIDHWLGWHAVFYTAAVLSAVMWFLIFIWLKETNTQLTPSLHPKHIGHAFVVCLSNRQFLLGMLLFSLIGATLLGAFYPVAPLLLISDLSMAKHAYSYWILLPALCYLLGALNTRRQVKRVKLTAIMHRSLYWQLAALILAGGWISILGFNVWSIMLPISLFSFSVSSLTPAANAFAMMALDEYRGAGAALIGCCVSGVSAIYTIVLSLSRMLTPWPMLLLLLLVVLISYALCRFGLRD